ncbi:MAG: DNA topoisomerase VI subunit B [Phycisphaerales bacterium]|nr:MAG: DNA topoisomerase VI subunit B [Phycisphaerales bacterium]
MAKTTERRKQTAETMAGRQREISVSEFFAKNRHLLGFDNPRKALLTTVKEAVDNALDACEEAGILPDITVELEELAPPLSASKSGRYRVTITDNGPGIVRRQVENIFGKLLYGSKFHRLKMSRGQQGIGISAAGMYGLMTTGKPMVITTRPNKKKPAHHIELAMDTSKNQPEVTVDIETDDFPETTTGTGTRVAIELEARYQRGKASVDTYLEQTAIANPHASITFIPPRRAGSPAEDPASEMLAAIEDAAEGPPDLSEHTIVDGRILMPRTIDELPPETQEIKPHPYGVELGNFLRMLKSTDEKQLTGFFKNEFCRVTPPIVKRITDAASTKGSTFSGQTWLKSLSASDSERLYRAMQEVKLLNPPTDCLSPIGVRQMLAGLMKGVRGEFYAASTRPAAVYRGNPFQIEAAIAFGGDLPGDQPARVLRFANRVPLLYQQSACSAFKSVTETAWKNYGLSQPRGGAPVGPLVIAIHMASVWVPFTSESKEAIADYDEIRKEMKLALQECGRKLGIYLRRRQRMRRDAEKRDVFERYIGEIAKACHAITGTDAAELYESLMRQAQRRTEIADAVLDEDGKIVGYQNERNGLEKDEGVVILDRSATPSASTAAAAPQPAADGADEPVETPVVTERPKKKILKKVKKKVRKKAGAAKGDDSLFGA